MSDGIIVEKIRPLEFHKHHEQNEILSDEIATSKNKLEVPKIRPETYDDLFDLKERLNQMQDREIEEILQTVIALDRDQLFKRKCIWIDLRNTTQSELNQTNKERVDNICKLHGVFLNGASVIAGVGSALCGGHVTIIGGLMGLAQQAASKTGDYQKELGQSTGLIFQHRYDSITPIKQEQTQQGQMADRDHKERAAKIDQIVQNIQRIFELMANSGS